MKLAELELEVDRIVGVDGVEYLRRYHVNGRARVGPSTRLHQLLTSDPQPDPHDHPWDFRSVLLTGAYDEWTPDGWHTWRAGDIVNRDAATPHRLDLVDGPMFTLVTVGAVRRRWGFHTATGWTHWRDYPYAGRYASSS